MESLDAIKKLYEDYLEETRRLQRERRPGEGLLYGRNPGDDPCHDAFYRQLGQRLAAAAQETGCDAREILEFLYGAPPEYADNQLAYWMLLAVHGLTEDLILRLSPQDAEELYQRYRKAYPRSMRLPPQKRVLAALRRQAG
jgi:hypothetical protein